MPLTSATLKPRPAESSEMELSEVLSAMTFALDLTEGAVPGHMLRSCLIGMRLGEALGLRAEMLSSLYYALLLKDVGCSSNAARMTCIVGGDDRALKAAAKLADWTRPHRPDVRTVQRLWRQVLPQRSVVRRAARLARIAMTQRSNNRIMIELRCERGAEIVRSLEMGEATAEAVRSLDEHWDGSGYPRGLRGEQIPVMARICLVAQNLDMFAMEEGPECSIEMLRRRSGTWFDPELVRLAQRLHRTGKLWAQCGVEDSAEDTRAAVRTLDPGERRPLSSQRIDSVCEAFASVVDAKSPFTYRHSRRVADVAVGLAREMGRKGERLATIRRGALLHDLGKLYVPNIILDKRGTLTQEEWAVVLEHPELTRSILQRVEAFHDLAVVCSEHHERLDGSGYPYRLKAEDTTMDSRIIAMADVYAAMIEARPYDVTRTPAEALQIIGRMVPHKMDPECFAALGSVVARGAQGVVAPVVDTPELQAC